MANKDDIEAARDIATLVEWRKGIDKAISSHDERIAEVEKWHQSITSVKPYIFPLLAIGAIAASALLLGGFYLFDPVTVQKILKSFMP